MRRGGGGGREETRWGRDSRQLFFYRGLDTSLSRIDTGKQFGQVSLRVKSVRLRFLTPDVLQLLRYTYATPVVLPVACISTVSIQGAVGPTLSSPPDQSVQFKRGSISMEGPDQPMAQ
ncbi:hypothetical protein OPV22_003162 [Ensete ventricosum]|uniref:Uncharacterized protein n=1 Tax=Ensete ventricosum TaxID=4639 RepID=A0AAV8S007_ENSVE|nr:hypothetical protein OPV22_003162 [Ensete ventricosum]